MVKFNTKLYKTQTFSRKLYPVLVENLLEKLRKALNEFTSKQMKLQQSFMAYPTNSNYQMYKSMLNFALPRW